MASSSHLSSDGLTTADLEALAANAPTLPLRWTVEVSPLDETTADGLPIQCARLEPAVEGLGVSAYGLDRMEGSVQVAWMARQGDAAEDGAVGTFEDVPAALMGIAAHVNAQLASWGVQPIATR